MDLKQIEKLMMAMRRFGTKRLVIKREGMEIELEREVEGKEISPELLAMLHTPKVQHHLPRAEAPLHPPHEEKKQPEGKFVQSPMVGTFYRAASPSDAPFIQVGDKITETSVVCIIEAMKVMNEIKAGVSGTVKELLVENGHPVEFGTKLFRVE